MGERCYLFKNLFLEVYFKTCYLRKEQPVSLVFKYYIPLSLQSPTPQGISPCECRVLTCGSHWTGSVFLHSSMDETCLPFGWCPACMLTLLFGKMERNLLFRLNLETVCNPECGFWSLLIYLTILVGICKASAVGDIAINRLSFRPSQSSLS